MQEVPPELIYSFYALVTLLLAIASTKAKALLKKVNSIDKSVNQIKPGQPTLIQRVTANTNNTLDLRKELEAIKKTSLKRHEQNTGKIDLLDKKMDDVKLDLNFIKQALVHDKSS